MQDIPVLIIVFNRAWNAVKVAESLQKIRPKQLFLRQTVPARNVRVKKSCARKQEKPSLTLSPGNVT